VGAARIRHRARCARLAVELERREPCEVWGEPRLCAAEQEADTRDRERSGPHLPDGRRLRRPHLVLFPDAALPVPVEVELSVKGPPRLEPTCRAWARCRIVSEVRYLCRRPCCGFVESCPEEALNEAG
jgi:hypothetical protein